MDDTNRTIRISSLPAANVAMTRQPGETLAPRGIYSVVEMARCVAYLDRDPLRDLGRTMNACIRALIDGFGTPAWEEASKLLANTGILRMLITDAGPTCTKVLATAQADVVEVIRVG